jgi:hypothetical protein
MARVWVLGFALLVACLVGLFLSASPVRAQGFDINEVTPGASVPQAVNQGVRIDPRATHPYSYRVTTTAHTYAGWEKSLIKKDVNLGHWCWIPITSYNQGAVRMDGVANRKGPVPIEKPAVSYTKPQRLEPVARPAGGVYVKPIKVALPERKYEVTLPARRHAVTAVKAVVHVPRPSEPPPPAVGALSYPRSAVSGVSGVLRSQGVNAALTAKDVHGKVLNKVAAQEGGLKALAMSYRPGNPLRRTHRKGG